MAITTAVAFLTSSEEERVLERSLLLVGGDGGEFPLLLLVGVVTLGLGGVVLLLGGVGGMSLGTGLGVDGWLTKHLANSAEIILVRGRVVIVIFILRLTIWNMDLSAVLTPLTRLPEAGAKVGILVHLPPSGHHVVGVVVHGGGVVWCDGWPGSVASPVGSDSSWSVLPGSPRGRYRV